MAQGQISRAQANKFLEQLFWTTSTGTTKEKTYHYIGLSTTDPGVNGTAFTEPDVSTGYKRRKLDMMNSPSNGQISNGDIIFFPESLGSWGQITHFFITTTLTGSAAIFSAPLTEAKTIPAGYVPIFREGALVVGIDKSTLE